MKIIIPGGAGHVGRLLVRELTREGHDCIVLTRHPGAVAMDGKQIAWDGRTLGPWAAELDGADVVINLAGRSVDCRYHERNLAEMMNSRVDSTRVIGAAIAAAKRPPRVWLKPEFTVEPRVGDDRFYRFLERTWRWQQLPLALALYAAGGASWVVWGSGVRLFASLTGHWLVGYLAHNRGARHWHIAGAAVQGYNVPGFALLTMGESWHNNHHAFPESARLGVRGGEWVPGWAVLRLLRRVGLVWNVATPETLPARPERIALEASSR